MSIRQTDDTYTGESVLGRGIIRGGPQVAGVEVSVILSEEHTLAASVSKFALESGALVSDHIIHEPDTLTVRYEVSNAGNGRNVARDVFEAFRRMKEENRLLEVETEHAIYRNMAIVSLSPMHTAPFRGRLQCVIKLERVNNVQLRVVGRQSGTMRGRDGKVFSPQKKAGQQEPQPVNDRTGIRKIQRKWSGV